MSRTWYCEKGVSRGVLDNKDIEIRVVNSRWEGERDLIIQTTVQVDDSERVTTTIRLPPRFVAQVLADAGFCKIEGK
jgi:hypothetical protein